MSSDTAPLISRSIPRGQYAPSRPSDLRSPCPLINALANHGYIPRDGRNIIASDLMTGMKQAGISHTYRAILAYPCFLEYKDPNTVAAQSPLSIWRKLWLLVTNPYALFFSNFALRRPGQFDSKGNKCIDLSQLAIHGAIEHDISLSRRDLAEGDNCKPDPQLIEEMIKSSSDGGKTISLEDLCTYQRRRIHEQLESNPGLAYGPPEHSVVCGQILMFIKVFGDGKRVPCEYVRALYTEERLPRREGWRKRWWSVGFIEIARGLGKVQNLMGIRF
jgi:hypothetical protein